MLSDKQSECLCFTVITHLVEPFLSAIHDGARVHVRVRVHDHGVHDHVRVLLRMVDWLLLST